MQDGVRYLEHRNSFPHDLLVHLYSQIPFHETSVSRRAAHGHAAHIGPREDMWDGVAAGKREEEGGEEERRIRGNSFCKSQ